jgi:transcriptional regulator with GAF, ATPase, and Fis domain
MAIDEDKFFRQATLCICSSLDIGNALFNYLTYIRPLIPVSEISMSLFEHGMFVMRNVARVTLDGIKEPYPPIQMTEEVIRQVESEDRAWRREIIIMNRPELNPAGRVLLPYVDVSNHSFIAMFLFIESKQLGALIVLMANGRDIFTKTHAHLISLLREPFSIAMSNALRYEEVLRLKDMLDAENRELSRELRYNSKYQIIGAEHGLKSMMEMVRKVAPLNTPVFLRGETGVGKEVVANAIHHSSPRSNAPFIKVNCGAIPENLIDSELFGHERGAFTGATTEKMGRFERANGGTIFLDEIGELPLHGQLRLLRVLQHKEIERVGGTKTIPVDVRLIAATHRNIEEMIRADTFREDLWFRLNVFPILVPALRHHKEDIPALVHHLVAIKSKQLKLYPPPPVSPGAMERLKSHSWPGNIRELENIIERELIYVHGRDKGRSLLFDHLTLPLIIDESPSSPDTKHKILNLDEANSQLIREALRITRGRIFGKGGAADLLGINPHTLRSRMRKLGLSFGRSEK